LPLRFVAGEATRVLRSFSFLCPFFVGKITLTSFIQNKKSLIFKKSTLCRKFIRKRTKESVGGGLKKMQKDVEKFTKGKKFTRKFTLACPKEFNEKCKRNNNN